MPGSWRKEQRGNWSTFFLRLQPLIAVKMVLLQQRVGGRQESGANDNAGCWSSNYNCGRYIERPSNFWNSEPDWNLARCFAFGWTPAADHLLSLSNSISDSLQYSFEVLTADCNYAICSECTHLTADFRATLVQHHSGYPVPFIVHSHYIGTHSDENHHSDLSWFQQEISRRPSDKGVSYPPDISLLPWCQNNNVGVIYFEVNLEYIRFSPNCRSSVGVK